LPDPPVQAKKRDATAAKNNSLLSLLVFNIL
jgi:hypothetical protein